MGRFTGHGLRALGEGCGDLSNRSPWWLFSPGACCAAAGWLQKVRAIEWGQGATLPACTACASEQWGEGTPCLTVSSGGEAAQHEELHLLPASSGILLTWLAGGGQLWVGRGVELYPHLLFQGLFLKQFLRSLLWSRCPCYWLWESHSVGSCLRRVKPVLPESGCH